MGHTQKSDNDAQKTDNSYICRVIDKYAPTFTAITTYICEYQLGRHWVCSHKKTQKELRSTVSFI